MFENPRIFHLLFRVLGREAVATYAKRYEFDAAPDSRIDPVNPVVKQAL